MAQFDPRRVLKQIANPLLKEFFTARGELQDVDWDNLTEHRIDPVFAAWQELDDVRRTDIQVVLQEIRTLADERGTLVIAEAVARQAPELAAEFEAVEGKHDKAMWAYLRLPETFKELILFAEADAHAAGRHWRRRNGLPARPIEVSDEVKQRLATGLSSYYGPTQMRGRRCIIEHYARHSDLDYFFAYLDDYPDKDLVFTPDHDEPVPRSQRRAFHNIFVFNPKDGSMEAFARGGKVTWEEIQRVFCRSVFGLELPPVDPLKPTYVLDHLIESGPLPTPLLDGVEDARIIRMRLVPRGSNGYIEVKADPDGPPDDIFRKIRTWTRSAKLTTASTRVQLVGFRLLVASDASGRPRSLSFDVSAPNSCNLKSHKSERLRGIGERFLQATGVLRDN